MGAGSGSSHALRRAASLLSIFVALCSSAEAPSERLYVTALGADAILLEWRWTALLVDAPGAPLDSHFEGRLGEEAATKSISLSVASGTWDDAWTGGPWPLDSSLTGPPLSGTTMRASWDICADSVHAHSTSGVPCLHRRGAHLFDALGYDVEELWKHSLEVLSGASCLPLGAGFAPGDDEASDADLRTGGGLSFLGAGTRTAARGGTKRRWSRIRHDGAAEAVLAMHLPGAGGLCAEALHALVLRRAPCGRWHGLAATLSIDAVLGAPWHAVTLDIDAATRGAGEGRDVVVRRSVFAALRLPDGRGCSTDSRDGCVESVALGQLLGSLASAGGVTEAALRWVCPGAPDPASTAEAAASVRPEQHGDACPHADGRYDGGSGIVVDPSLLVMPAWLHSGGTAEMSAGPAPFNAARLPPLWLPRDNASAHKQLHRVSVDRQLSFAGSSLGLGGGAVVTRVQLEPSQILSASAAGGLPPGNESSALSVVVVTVLPWFMQPLAQRPSVAMHCADGDQDMGASWNLIDDGRDAWAEEEPLDGLRCDAEAPIVLAHSIDIGRAASACQREMILTISVAYAAALLHAEECPPDTHHGLDIPAGIVLLARRQGWGAAEGSRECEGHVCSGVGSLGDVVSELTWPAGGGALRRYSWEEESSTLFSRSLFFAASARRGSVGSGALDVFQVVSAAHSRSLVVEPLCPDFAMPYNVVVLVPTVLAFVLGAVFNASARRPRQRPAPRSSVSDKSASRPESRGPPDSSFGVRCTSRGA